MSNVYYKNFWKYSQFVKTFTGEDYLDLIEEVNKICVPLKDDGIDRRAVVMFGFSGNGKSTWIRNFCKENPDYEILSMDRVVRKRERELGRRIEGMEITGAFSRTFDQVVSTGKNVIVDGNFLNLLTRMSLVDSFHECGYKVSLIDITPIFDVTIERRIMDEASRVMGVTITPENICLFSDNPTYKAVENHVMSFHKDERERASYDEQIVAGGIGVNVEGVIVVDNNSKGDNIGGKKM